MVIVSQLYMLEISQIQIKFKWPSCKKYNFAIFDAFTEKSCNTE